MKAPYLLLAFAVALGACENPLPTDPVSPPDGSAAPETAGPPALDLMDPGYPFAVTVRRSTGANFGPNETWMSNSYADIYADVTGDGAADAITIGGAVSIRRAIPALRTFGATETWVASGAAPPWYSHFADVDGDGRKDLVTISNYGKTFEVRKSTGSGFTAPTPWLTGSLALTGTKGTFFADVDGDRKADAVLVNDNSISVRPSTGSSFTTSQIWLSGVTAYGFKGTRLADVNGDGKADHIAVNEQGLIVRLAEYYTMLIAGVPTVKLRFGNAKNWTNGAFYGDETVSWSPVYFADVNNDRKVDAIAVNGYGVTVRRSTGLAFSGNEAWTTNPYYGHICSENNFFPDVSGDGMADAVVVNVPNPACIN